MVTSLQVLRRLFSGIVIFAVAAAYATPVEHHSESRGTYSWTSAAELLALHQAGRTDARPGRLAEVRTPQGDRIPVLLGILPCPIAAFIVPTRAWESTFEIHRARPGECVSSGRSSRGPPRIDSLLLES